LPRCTRRFLTRGSGITGGCQDCSRALNSISSNASAYTSNALRAVWIISNGTLMFAHDSFRSSTIDSPTHYITRNNACAASMRQNPAWRALRYADTISQTYSTTRRKPVARLYPGIRPIIAKHLALAIRRWLIAQSFAGLARANGIVWLDAFTVASARHDHERAPTA